MVVRSHSFPFYEMGWLVMGLPPGQSQWDDAGPQSDACQPLMLLLTLFRERRRRSGEEGEVRGREVGGAGRGRRWKSVVFLPTTVHLSICLLTPDFYHFYPLLLWFWFSDLTPSLWQEWVFLFQETECSPRGNTAPKDTWQFLELYLIVTFGMQSAIGIWWVEARDTI